jgi:Pyridoxamine 5'-phosphate oxidase
MPTKQGDVSLLQDPVAQELLKSSHQAKLAYVWSDGTPRVIPIWFHWNGKEIVFGSPTGAPKLKVLKDGTKVAITIDSETPPWQVLYVRGSIRIEIVDGASPEYIASAKRHIGEEAANAWLAQAGPLVKQMARILVTPEWVGILDFEKRMPSAIEKAIEAMQGGGNQ